jgi:type I restriction enzyme R subunit
LGERDIAAFPKLSDRNDIIVMTDEAHRSQYADLAMNMRNALPNARFIGFTGTPLLAEDEKTREQFGEYISRYDFRQSIEDGATVPLYYEIRKPAAATGERRLSGPVNAVD